ncbi:MAG: hypothetical protein Q7J85_08405 [Bacillota bacterium]|nr:hypothetical protein [Bacillota bacterium]
MSAAAVYIIVALYFAIGTIVAVLARRSMGAGMADFFWPTGQLGVLWQP